MTFAEFKSSLRDQLWPEGEAENLISVHDKSFMSALIDAQRWVTCFKVNHTDVIPCSETLFQCGVTVLDRPDGITKGVRTIYNGNHCTRITYHPASYAELNRWSRGLSLIATAPVNKGMAPLALSFKYPEASSDSAYGRALEGIYAVEGNRMYVAPWLQSTESLVIDWDGNKVRWLDTDLIPYGDVVMRYVRLFAQCDRPMDFPEGKDMLRAWRADLADELAKLIYDCRQQTNLIDTTTVDSVQAGALDMVSALADPTNHGVWTGIDNPSSGTPGGSTSNPGGTTEGPGGNTVPPPIGDGGTPTTNDGTGSGVITMDFAVIGDSAQDGAPNTDDIVAVANLIKSVKIHALIHCGDMATNGSDYDTAVGMYYGKYIYPYRGTVPAYAGTAPNHFHPAIGNHDVNVTTDIGDYLDYFNPPNNGRYYDFVIGACHFFVLNPFNRTDDGMPDWEADVTTIGTSRQFKWFAAAASRATSPWKIVILHTPPYTSDTTHTPGSTAMRWPFATYGIDLVYSGHAHDYERLLVGGVNYVVTGTGGGPLYDFGTPVSGSVIRYNANHGASFATADCSNFIGKFVNVYGDEIDSFHLTK